MLCMSFLWQECCVVLTVPQTVSFLFSLFLFLLNSVRPLFQCVQCYVFQTVCDHCIAACAMQRVTFPKSLQPRYGYSLMQHFNYKCSITCFWTCMCSWYHKRRFLDELTSHLLCFQPLCFLSCKSFDYIILMQIHGKDLHFLQKLPSVLQQIRVHFNQTVLTRHTSITSEWSWIKSSWAWDCIIGEMSWTIHVPGTLPEQRANGCMSVDNCATDVCLKFDPSPTGHECSSNWALKKVRCLNIFTDIKSSHVALPKLSQRMTHHLSIHTLVKHISVK